MKPFLYFQSGYSGCRNDLFPTRNAVAVMRALYLAFAVRYSSVAGTHSEARFKVRLRQRVSLC